MLWVRRAFWLLLWVASVPPLFGQTAPFALTGRVVGPQGQALAYVTVALVRAPSGPAVEGALTNAAGEFALHYAGPPGSYQLVLSYLGHETLKTPPFALASRTWEAPFVLRATGQALGEVQVFGQQDVVTAAGGNLRVNVANSVTAAGLTAYDLLRRAPGVAIGRDNELSLNGKAGVRLLLDGKLVYLEGADLVALLKTLPATSVSALDLLASPGVQYDAAGTAGLIDIRTKKGTAEGLNGSATVGAAYWLSPKQNADVNLNFRRGNLNLYGSYNHYVGHYGYDYTLYRVQEGTRYDSPTADTDKRAKVNGTVGLDYRLGERHTLGVVASTNLLFGPGLTNTTTRIGPDATGQVEQVLSATNDYYHQHSNRYNAGLNYRYEGRRGRTLGAAADYGYFSGGSRNYQPNVYRRPTGEVLQDNQYRSLTATGIDLLALKADYQDSLGRGRLEAGVKFASVSSANDYRFYRVQGPGEVLDAQRSNEFAYRERIGAAYASYQRPLGTRLSAQAGLRLESTHTRGQLSYPAAGAPAPPPVARQYLNLFPAASIAYRPSAKRSFTLSASRRLDRPAYQNLNPFVTLLDELSFWQGNAFLQPQYATRGALDYSTATGWTASLAYTHTRDIIAQVNDTLQGNKVVMTPRNVGRQRHLGLTLTRTFAPAPWWSISASATLYYVDNQIAFDANRQFRLRALAGTGNLQQTFQLPHRLTAELSGYFNAPTASPANERQGANGQLDVGVRRKFWGDAASVSLAVSDVFLTAIWNNRTEFSGFYLHSYGHGESRQVRVNFAYAFGNQQLKAPRERKDALDAENGRIK